MGGLRPSGLHVNKPVVFGLLGVALLVFVVTRLYMGGGLPGSIPFMTKGAVPKAVGAGRGSTVTNPPKMDNVLDAAHLEAVPALAADATIEKKEEEMEVTLAGKTIKIHVVQMISTKADLSKGLTVFLLHGMAFSSQNWLDIKTMEHVANWGHRAVAIDLPGKGKSPEAVEEAQSAQFLTAFITKMSMTKIVIVSPSMSGRYALPFLFEEPKTSTDRAVGYVPVAPVGTSKFTAQYPDSQLPTLIVYGTKDAMGPATLNDLKLLPKHKVAPIADAGHACYMNKTDDFHKVLFHFLKELSS